MFVGILVSGGCGCEAPSAEWFMLIAESVRVHLHGVVTRDVRLSFLKIQKCFLKLERYEIFNRYSRSELQRSDTGN